MSKTIIDMKPRTPPIRLPYFYRQIEAAFTAMFAADAEADDDE